MVQAHSFLNKTDEKPKILVIAGPTAIGKSQASVRLAKFFGAEIISADSMQIYRRFNIGTGKITAEEAEGIVHHMIDIADADENYSVGRYVEDARKIIYELHARQKPVIITGGTGLYLNALLNGYNFAGIGSSESIRDNYRIISEKDGNKQLFQLLSERDPESAAKISVNDTKRLIRALEIFELTGEAKSNRLKQGEKEFNALMIVLTDDREALYKRINRRVDRMVELGLEREVRLLSEYRNFQSMQAIGYKEFVDYFDNLRSLTETIELIKKNSRNYAKRQMTFFRWIKADKVFIDINNFATIFEVSKNYIMSDMT